jgi:hypothetical protein
MYRLSVRNQVRNSKIAFSRRLEAFNKKNVHLAYFYSVSNLTNQAKNMLLCEVILTKIFLSNIGAIHPISVTNISTE